MLVVVVVGLDLDAVANLKAAHVGARRHVVNVQLPVAAVRRGAVTPAQHVRRRALLVRMPADSVVGLGRADNLAILEYVEVCAAIV